MQLTIHRGAKEIGGSCVEIRTASTRILLDLGLPLDETRRDELPPVTGVFERGNDALVDGIVLSHAHPDHFGLIEKSRTEIPVYLTAKTNKMLFAASVFAKWERIPETRAKIVKENEPFQIGDIQITAIPVDHSIYGAYALLVEADGKRVLYSGDLRLHGKKHWMWPALRKVVQRKPLDVLIMEGTSMGANRPAGLTEDELCGQIEAEINSAPGLVWAMFTPLHVDRFCTFFKAARRSGRVFVGDAYTAFVRHLLHNERGIPKPGMTEGDFRVFFPKYFTERKELQYKRAFIAARKAVISLDEIKQNPGKYVMLFRPSMLTSDFKDHIPAQTKLIYSYWSGYLEMEQSNWKDLPKTMQVSGGSFVKQHCGGHIYEADIPRFVNSLEPKMIIPIHTGSPESYCKVFSIDQLRLLEDGVPFQL